MVHTSPNSGDDFEMDDAVVVVFDFLHIDGSQICTKILHSGIEVQFHFRFPVFYSVDSFVEFPVQCILPSLICHVEFADFFHQHLDIQFRRRCGHIGCHT